MLKHPAAGLAIAGMFLGVWSTAAVGAAKIPREVLEHMSAEEQIAYITTQVEAQRTRAHASASVTLDIIPPIITGFNAAAKLNVGLAQPNFKVNIKAQDDLSGVESVKFFARGPSGQYIYGYYFPGSPSTSVSGLGGLSPINGVLEPGTYTFTYAYVYDNAGNATYTPNSALAALGNTTFTIVNGKGYDITPPTLVSGQITKGAASLSQPAEGTADTPPFLGMKVTVEDTGNTALAGVRNASATFCLMSDPTECIALSGSIYATAQASATVALKGQVSAANGNVPGTYHLNTVTVQDQGGMFTTLQSIVFGGTTDFTAYFPKTTIKINP